MTDIRAPIDVGKAPPLSDSMKSFIIMILVWCVIESGRFAYEMGAVIRKLQARNSDRDNDDMLINIKDFIRSSYFVTAQIPILSVLILFSEWRSKIVLDGSPNAADPLFIPIAVIVCIQATFLFFDTCENATLKMLNLAIQALSKLSLVIIVIIAITRIFEAKKAAPLVDPNK
jgi:hypothetical protein